MPKIIGVNMDRRIASFGLSEEEMIDEAAKETSKKDTKEHIGKVRYFLLMIADELVSRGFEHDASKLEEPELSLFAEWGPKLSGMKYGSPMYNDALKQMGPALRHHYEHNLHHPEHWGEDGVNGMTLIDLIEMICDWKAASLRMKDGDFKGSVDYNEKRFLLDADLPTIIRNTAAFFEERR